MSVQPPEQLEASAAPCSGPSPADPTNLEGALREEGTSRVQEQGAPSSENVALAPPLPLQRLQVPHPVPTLALSPLLPPSLHPPPPSRLLPPSCLPESSVQLPTWASVSLFTQVGPSVQPFFARVQGLSPHWPSCCVRGGAGEAAEGQALSSPEFVRGPGV